MIVMHADARLRMMAINNWTRDTAEYIPRARCRDLRPLHSILILVASYHGIAVVVYDVVTLTSSENNIMEVF